MAMEALVLGETSQDVKSFSFGFCQYKLDLLTNGQTDLKDLFAHFNKD